MNQLTGKRCIPCEGGVDPLTRAQVDQMLLQIDGWSVNEVCTEISRDFKFEDFYRTMAYLNALAWMAHIEDHHPDLEVGYGHCLIRYTTHAIGGLSENDFICAAKADEILAQSQGEAPACNL